MRELVIPTAAQQDHTSFEMIRVWIAAKGLHTTINVGAWESHSVPEERAWGMMLADVVRHVSNAMQSRYGKQADDTQSQVVRALLKELKVPTTEVHGAFWEH